MQVLCCIAGTGATSAVSSRLGIQAGLVSGPASHSTKPSGNEHSLSQAQAHVSTHTPVSLHPPSFLCPHR
ncbi:hypothetical protein ACRRTK_015248 [Alexandromys fortis]